MYPDNGKVCMKIENKRIAEASPFTQVHQEETSHMLEWGKQSFEGLKVQIHLLGQAPEGWLATPKPTP
jgi:hypothetical protein